ncbi:MAG: polysaccharide biosynthesis protein [Flavobacteriaceae bacterium]|nr:polysaccharide biosynthesis protein [Flavobacteriaceae bacterium]
MDKLRSLYNSKSAEAPKLLHVFVDQVFMSVSTLLTTIVLARTYEKIVYADLVLLFSLALFILGLQSSAISKPYAINLNDYKGGQRFSFFHFTISLKLLFTLLVILVFPILYKILFNEWDVSRLFHYLFFIIAYTLYFFVRETLLSERKTKENLWYGVFCSSGLITLLGLIYFNRYTSLEFYLRYASIIYFGISCVYLIKNISQLRVYRKRYFSYLRANWKVGRWLVGSNMLFHLSSNIYPWLLLYLTTKSDIAIFGVLMSVGNVVNPVLTAVNSYLLPVFVRRNQFYEKVHRLVNNWAIFFIIMAVVLVGVGYFFGQELIIVLFGDKYAELGLLVLYPFVVQAIKVVFQPFKIALEAIKRTDINFWVLIPRSIIALVVGYFLVKNYGLLGVFYTMIAENLVYQLLHFTFYQIVIRKKSVTA